MKLKILPLLVIILIAIVYLCLESTKETIIGIHYYDEHEIDEFNTIANVFITLNGEIIHQGEVEGTFIVPKIIEVPASTG
ncbi:MAG: hypothetical protein AAF242_03355 [Bacteroidota bacterium]